MQHIIADAELESRLGGILEPIEIRDVKGKLLGVFTPHVSPEVRAWYDKARTQFDPTEGARRLAAANGQGVPLAEVWRRIEAGEQPK